MTTSSARPDRLRQYAADTVGAANGARGAADAAAVAATRFAAGGGDAALATPAVLAARTALDRLRTLADTTRSIGDAFAAADSGAGLVGPGQGNTVIAGDLALSLALRHDAPGLVDEELLVPLRYDQGATFARSIEHLQGEERRARLADARNEDGYGPAFAAGFIQTLGPEGLIELVDDERRTYASGDALYEQYAPALAGLGALFAEADRTVVDADDPVALRAALASASSTSDPYDLDLDLVQDLGRTAEGRNVLRHLVLDGPALSAPTTVVLADILAVPDLAEEDRRKVGSEQDLLDDRVLRRWGQSTPDLPILKVVAENPLAAWTWDESRPGGRSPVAAFLPGRTALETEQLGRIVNSVLVVPVQQGWSSAYRIELEGFGVDKTISAGPPPPVSLDEIIAVAGQATPTRELSDALAATQAVHIEAFRERGAEEASSGEEDKELREYYRVVAFDRDALAAATVSGLDGYKAEVARVLDKNPPIRLDYTDVTTGLADSGNVLRAVERGAFDAGKHHNFLLGLAIPAVGYGTKFAAKKVAERFTGPASKVITKGTDKAVDVAQDAATDRWVDTQDGRSEKGADLTARAKPYIIAVGMAEDADWAKVVVHPEMLREMNVVDSQQDRLTFALWLSLQPPVVQKPILGVIDPPD